MKLPLNIVSDTDYYKFGHHLGYKRGLSNLYSYGEPRIGAKFDHVVFFGLQAIIMDQYIGNLVTEVNIEQARKKNEAWGGYKDYFNEKMWQEIKNKYGGKLPIRIRAVKEGTRVPISNVLFTIEALDEIAVPLVNHIETTMYAWYPTTVCTNSYEIKKDQYQLLLKTGTPELIEYLCHDFGYRGVSCQQEAMYGGMAHLVNYRGSDTTVADRGIDHYYGYSEQSRMKSVLATEHSVAETFGEGEGEYEYVKHILSISPKDSISSIVIDTYDAINFIENVITRPDVKKMIEERTGKVVFRPDSGNPIEITNRIINSLGNNFGLEYNRKHYKVLNPRVGIIYGDSMDKDTIKPLYESIISNGWSADNLVVGSGGGLLRKFDRDTQRFAIKASYGVINGKEVNLIKNPATQSSKKSKKGRLKLHQSGNSFSTISSADETPAMFSSYADSLETVYEMGELVRKQSFDDIIKTTNEYFMDDINGSTETEL